MNKNLKRALNTTAAVSMSLAMVLGAVSPVGAARINDPSITDKTAVKDAYKLVGLLYDEIGDDVYETFKNDGNFAANVDYTSTDKAFDFSNKTLSGLLSANVATGTDAWDGATTVAQLVSFVADNSSYIDDADKDVVDFAKFLNGLTDGVNALSTGTNAVADAAGKLDSNFKAHANAVVANGVTNYNASSAYYKVIVDNENYLNAVFAIDNGAAQNPVTTDYREDALELIESFKAEVEDYKGENEDTFVKRYVRELEDYVVANGKTVYDLVEKEEDINYSDLAKVEKAVKAIKGDTAKLADGTKLSDIAKYDDVKDAEEVAAYIEGLEAIVEDMKEVKDILKSTNEDVKAYNKNLKTLVNGLHLALTRTYTDIQGGATAEEQKEIAIENAMLKFRSEDRTALKEFVESYVEQFYALTPKQLNSGKYVVRLENAEYGRYVNTTDVFDNGVENLQAVLTTVINNEESADTYYDELVEAVTTVDELLKAVTTDIEGLTFDTKITSVEANKIVKAKKALNQLVVNGNIASEYAPALTRAEEKEILVNAELIEALYFKLIINGEVTTIGWVQTPQGWEYYDNNGKRVTDGWAAGNGYWSYMKNGYAVMNDWCAAKEGWYYMGADGKMVTGKVTINGVEEDFGTDGIWVRK